MAARSRSSSWKLHQPGYRVHRHNKNWREQDKVWWSLSSSSLENVAAETAEWRRRSLSQKCKKSFSALIFVVCKTSQKKYNVLCFYKAWPRLYTSYRSWSETSPPQCLKMVNWCLNTTDQILRLQRSNQTWWRTNFVHFLRSPSESFGCECQTCLFQDHLWQWWKIKILAGCPNKIISSGGSKQHILIPTKLWNFLASWVDILSVSKSQIINSIMLWVCHQCRVVHSCTIY